LTAACFSRCCFVHYSVAFSIHTMVVDYQLLLGSRQLSVKYRTGMGSRRNAA
jgi:hypothetical protein